MRDLPGDVILTLWLVWLLGWTIAGWRTKAAIRVESRASRLSHGVPLILGVILLISPRAGGPWLATRILAPAGLWLWLATALVVIGLGIATWARIHLAGNWSGTVTLKAGHTLIRGGPYRFTRHPIYTGLLVAILGSAIATGEWRGVVGLALVALAFLRKIAIEERFLLGQFGDDYRRYRSEVPALIPWF